MLEVLEQLGEGTGLIEEEGLLGRFEVFEELDVRDLIGEESLIEGFWYWQAAHASKGEWHLIEEEQTGDGQLLFLIGVRC